MQEDMPISATEAQKLIEAELGRPISFSKVVRLMREGKIPSEKSVMDSRKRIAKRSDVMKWIDEARRQGLRPAWLLGLS